jgi:hypothetical protein
MMTAAKQPRIAVIAWGSLTWDDSRQFQRCSDWRFNGPALPVEFARVTSQREKNQTRVSLVLLAGATPVVTYWTEVNFMTVEDARRELAKAEGTTGSDPLSKIGFWSASSTSAGRLRDTILDVGKWASALGLDSAVWTDLKPNLPNDSAQVFSPDLLPAVTQRIEQYRSHPKWFSEARDYVERAPRQITTLCRAALNAHFGWTCRSEL